uniref:Urease accessory protein UreD 3 n=2 Tax=Anthurium amnicola TaxID=1678845 RepID=A0A1D1YEQ6_9ARAE
MNKNVPAAIHSIVVRTPAGAARTHRFATKTVELPAQEGERVTITLASSAKIFRGPFSFNPRPPQFSPGEPMCLTNHTNGQESQLLRAPAKDGNSFLLNPSFLFPALTLLATGDAASGIIDPSLPRFISIAAIASVAVGATINHAILPQLNQLPKRKVDAIALKQQLLSQYDLVQNRIRGLIQTAEEEVWMLARMCQLENKIVAVGEPSYRARRVRVKRVCESLENSLMGRIELIESYAKISSMIEIEVEMDSDVLAAEAVSNAESIAEQIQQAMEIENLEERWQIQAEANDEVERLLRSQPMSSEHV